MPTPQELLWDTVKEKQLFNVKAIIESYPEADLINSLNPKSGKNLPMHLISSIMINKKFLETFDLLRFVLSHSSMDWRFEFNGNTAASTLLEAATYYNDFFLFIESLNHVKGFLISNNRLTYDLAAQRVKAKEQYKDLQINDERPQAAIAETQTNINKCKSILSLIRDMTILYAIKTDDADLFDRLHKSGGDPLGKLGVFGENSLPSDLIGKDQLNPKIRCWCEDQEEIKQNDIHINRYLFLLTLKAENQKKYETNAIKILNEAAKNRNELIEEVIACDKPPVIPSPSCRPPVIPSAPVPKFTWNIAGL